MFIPVGVVDCDDPPPAPPGPQISLSLRCLACTRDACSLRAAALSSACRAAICSSFRRRCSSTTFSRGEMNLAAAFALLLLIPADVGPLLLLLGGVSPGFGGDAVAVPAGINPD